MKFSKYRSSLLPSFSKDRVLEDCRLTKKELLEETVPSYNNAMAILKGWKFKSPKIIELQNTFNNLVASKSRNMFVTIADGLPEILKNLEEVEGMIDKNYNHEIASMSLTYLKGNLLQLVEACAFVSNFARKLLNYSLVCETKEADTTAPEIADTITMAEERWLMANFISFVSAFSIVSEPSATVKKALDGIPDITITSGSDSILTETIGEKKFDPFTMGLIPVWMNPIYHVGLIVAEWQAERYSLAKEERRLIELRIINLKNLQENKPDARTQKVIEYNQERVRNLNRKITKMEEKYA